MQKDETVRLIKSQSPDAFLPKARKRGWICPVCGNGEGKDGDGIVLNKKTVGSYKCFRHLHRLLKQKIEGIGNISVAEIREKVKNHISVTGNRHPVVFIDYLQILKACEGDERATDKQVVDHNVTALKQLSRDFDITVCAVSSLNRENYRAKISMTAFNCFTDGGEKDSEGEFIMLTKEMEDNLPFG